MTLFWSFLLLCIVYRTLMFKQREDTQPIFFSCFFVQLIGVSSEIRNSLWIQTEEDFKSPTINKTQILLHYFEAVYHFILFIGHHFFLKIIQIRFFLLHRESNTKKQNKNKQIVFIFMSSELYVSPRRQTGWMFTFGFKLVQSTTFENLYKQNIFFVVVEVFLNPTINKNIIRWIILKLSIAL